MVQNLQILAVFFFTALSAIVFWFAYDSEADSGFPPDALEAKRDRYVSLLSLDVGDAVVVRGNAAGGREGIVRPVAFADPSHVWVEGRKFRRFDGWQADSGGWEIDPSWIEPGTD